MKVNELAQTVGISAAYLSQIENHKRNPNPGYTQSHCPGAEH
ncbi:MAG TPA: XRE family transcriptional regulator [Chloroflexi bacterium]|nr:XRE family transcriptional regulator [Chloroflexota bacterium]